MKRITRVVIALAALMLASAAPVLACDEATSTHVGKVTAIDPARTTFTIKDAATGEALTFVASPEQLQGLRVDDEIEVVYAPEGQGLRATSIKKG